MRYVKTHANEFLVVGRRGRLRNLGTAAGAWLLPGSTCVRVPGTKQEAAFAMTQESEDGIPLRFKGLVLYRVVDPLAAATMFDFSGRDGLAQIQRAVEQVCLGELRDIVSHKSMRACIEERKTTLSEGVGAALRGVALGRASGEGGRWGVEFDLVQVAQVFIVDDELRRRLEAGLRNEIRARSEEADLHAAEQGEIARLVSRRRVEAEQLASAMAAVEGKEQVRRAGILSERRLAEEELESERERVRIAEERAKLEQALGIERLQAAAPVRRLELEMERDLAALAVEAGRIRNEARALEVERDLCLDRARQALERDMLPLRQAPQVAEALSRMLQGANLSIYGAEGAWTSTVGPLVEFLTRRLAVPAPAAVEGKS